MLANKGKKTKGGVLKAIFDEGALVPSGYLMGEYERLYQLKLELPAWATGLDGRLCQYMGQGRTSPAPENITFEGNLFVFEPDPEPPDSKTS